MKRRKLYYLTSGDVLKGRVEPILWMKTCEWLSKYDFDVRLITTYYFRKENIKRSDIFTHFGVKPLFEIIILPTILSKKLSNINWIRLNILLYITIYLFPLFLKKNTIVFFSKSRICMEIICVLEKFFKKSEIKIFEIHKFNNDSNLLRLLNKMQLIIVNSLKVKNILIANGVNKDKIILTYLAPHSEGKSFNKDIARRKLCIDNSKFILTYIGKLYEENLFFLIEIAKKLKNSKYELHIVGGNPIILNKATELQKRHRLKNIIFHGFIPPSQVGIFASASDLLFCSYSNNLPFIDQSTPAKYFDYIYYHRPFFSSNNTAIRELLVDKINCIYFLPENPLDFIKKLKFYSDKKELLDKMVKSNDILIKKLTWENRTKEIISYINKIFAERERAVNSN